MKGNIKVIQILNDRLKEELTAIHQYIVHSEMVGNWGYKKLKDYFMSRAISEMKHVEMIIERILFLEGTPNTMELGKIFIGATITEMLKVDGNSEKDAIIKYNTSIKLCSELEDNGTKELFERILKDEESHLDDIEIYETQLSQLGTQIFLSEQV